jgi:hypothetical protein
MNMRVILGPAAKTFRVIAVIVMLLPAANGPAGADDESQLADRITNALKFVKSFEMVIVRTDSENRPLSTRTTVFVAPDRLSQHLSENNESVDAIFIGDTGFRRGNAEPYRKISLRPTLVQSIRHTPYVSVSAVLPDVKTSSGVYGAYQTNQIWAQLTMTPLDPHASTVTCMYDRKTYLPTRCSGLQYEQLFGKYNDPTNVVEAPKEVK